MQEGDDVAFMEPGKSVPGKRPSGLRRWLGVLWAILRVARRDWGPGAKTGQRLTMSDVLLMLVHSITGANRLWLASRLAEEIGQERAIKFAQAHVHDAQLPGVNLLRANASIGNDALWVRYVNQYLECAGMAPIALSARPGSLFTRLQSGAQGSGVDGELISVIMPAFNAGKLMAHAAGSILAQSWRNLELIIVDDCSTDDTWEIACALAASDPRVRVLKNEVNVGPYVSKNLALRIARGRYITGQDADDWSHPDRLKNDMCVLLAGGGDVKAVLSMMLRMDGKGEFCVFSQRGIYVKDGMRRPASISLLVEADYLHRYLGGWDSVRFGADSEFIGRIDKIMGSGLKRTNHVGMFCQDLDTSLTNHPLHGVSKMKGISPVRKQYRAAYLKWHEGLGLDSAKLPFPHIDRRYEAPEPMRVPLDAVERNIAAHASQWADAETARVSASARTA